MFMWVGYKNWKSLHLDHMWHTFQ